MATWRETIDPIVKKYELAAMFNMTVTSNAESCTAKAALMRNMARIIDTEIDWRGRGIREWRLFGWRIRLSRDGEQ